VAKPTALDEILAHPQRTEVALYGTRAAERYGDDRLGALGALPIEKLSLHRQAITKLPPLQPTLKSLELGECPIESLAGIERCTSLQTLRLTELPRLDFDDLFDLLAELPELTELRLGGASLKSLPPGLEKLPSLLELRFEESPQLDLASAVAHAGRSRTLRSVAIHAGGPLPDAFAPLTHVHRLAISRGRGDLPPSLFGLAELRHLGLEWSSYKVLPPAVGTLTKLESLSLRGTPIAVLPDELCDCVSLLRLDLEMTMLKTLPAQIGRLAKLEVLNVQSGKLKTLPDSIGDLAALRTLFLPFGDTLVVPDSLARLRLEKFIGPDEIERTLALLPPPTPHQERLILYEADRLPDDFGDPIDLTLRLHTHAVPLAPLFELRRLRQLTVDATNLAEVFARVAHCAHLRELTIEGERESLPDTLGELVQLQRLTIDSGDPTSPMQRGVLASLPDAIGQLGELEVLRIARHAMTKLPDSIGKLARLRELHLDPADLVELPAALGELQQLQQLHLETPGKLVRLPDELASCAALAEVAIDGRWGTGTFQLANLDVLARLPALRILRLVGDRRFHLEPVVRALAGSALEELDLRDTHLPALPAEVGRLAKLRRLHLHGTQLKNLPPELRACSELRYISVPLYELDRDVGARLKDHLPKGRWKKHYRSGVTWYERTDV